VTATRDGTLRALAVDDTVAGDDVIETGADGYVAIRLHHNLVPWSLGPGKKEQVAASLAWKAPRATQTAAGPTGERSGAAGRHAEREAADTAANSVAAPESAMPSAAAAPAAPAPPPPPADERAVNEKVAARDSSDDKGAMLGDAPGESLGAGGLGLSGTGAGGGGAGEGIGLGNLGTLGHGSGTGSGRGFGAGPGGRREAKPSESKGIVRTFAARGGLETSIVTRVIRSRNARLLSCVAPDAPARAMVKLKIKPDGKVDEVTVAGVSLKASQCLEKWMRATTFPKGKDGTQVSVLVQGADPLGGL
jgi:hypothetical protein